MRALPDNALPEGFLLLPGLLGPRQRLSLIAELSTLPPGAAGERELLAQPWCRDLAQWLCGLPRLQTFLPAGNVAVQCTLFEKSQDRNWLVTLHQDLAIPVAERVRDAPLRGWSVKGGRHFVLAPPEVLGQMLAVRLHLDDATQAEGGLRFVPRSHRHGVLGDEAVQRGRATSGEVAVDARAGDALLMRPLVLHASSKVSAATSSRRRVLHFLFGPSALPHGLRWHEAA